MKRNIVPIFKEGFVFPPSDNLPAPLRELPRINGLQYSHHYYNASIEKLIAFLTTDIDEKLPGDFDTDPY